MRKILVANLIFIVFLLTSCTNYNSMFGVGITQDVDYPEIYITSPKTTDCVAGAFNVKGYATDQGGLYCIILEYSDAKGKIHLIKQPTTRDFDIPLNFYNEDITTGDFEFSITAIDLAEHKTTVFLNVTVDKLMPEITLFNPVVGSENRFENVLVGKINFSGVVSDNYAIKTYSANNVLKIYELGDETNVIFRQNIYKSPFTVSGFDTMDESHKPDDYVMCISFEDVNGNIGKKIINFSTAKGDTSTYLSVISPNDNAIFTDAMTIAGSAVNAFSNVKQVNYRITYRDKSLAIVNSNSSGTLTVGMAGGFSEILSLKNKLGNVSEHKFDLRLTAIAEDGSSSETKVIPFEFNRDLADYEFIDSSETSIVAGTTPLMSSYINDEFDIQMASKSTLFEIMYSIVQNGVALVDWTSIKSTMETVGNISKYSVHIKPSEIGLDNGAFNILAKATIAEDQVYRPISRVVNYDTVAPQVFINSPEKKTAINGAVTIAGSAGDNLGLKNVLIREDDIQDAEFKRVDGSLSIWNYVVSKDDLTSDITIEQKYNIPSGQTRDVHFTIKALDYADNESEIKLTLTVEPDSDKPVITVLEPAEDDTRVSSSLTVSAVIIDDDFPKRSMASTMAIYQYKAGLTVDGYLKETAVWSKNFQIDAITGDPNLSSIIEIENEKFIDLQKYAIVLTGSGWKNKKADSVIRTFFVDKNAPTITIDNYDPTQAKYFTDTIRFTGSVTYKADSRLAQDTPFILQYPSLTGATGVARVELSDAISVDGNAYKKQTFDITINSDGSTSGFVAGFEPTLTWGDTEWGNSNKLWTFRATSNTAVQSYRICRIYLDNHTPTVKIVSPDNGCLFSEPDVQSFNLQFTVDDEPAEGTSLPLNMTNVLIEYKFANNDGSWTTLLDYGAGNKATNLAGTVNYTVDFNKIIEDGVGHQLRLSVKDFAGNVSEPPAVLTFSKNTKPPKIETFQIKDAKPTNYYNGELTVQVTASDNYGQTDDGIKTVKLYLDDEVIETRVEPAETNLEFTIDTTQHSDGLHILSVEVTDKSGITVNNRTYSKSDLPVVIDNTSPTLETCQLLSMGEDVNSLISVDKWSSYIGLQLSAYDEISLYGASPEIKIGTTSNGSDILPETTLAATMNGMTNYNSTYSNWIDLYQTLGDKYDSTNKIFVTVTIRDVAGNVATTVKQYDKATLPNVAFSEEERHPYGCTGNSLEVKGTCDVNVGKVWVKVGSSDWKSATVSSGQWNVSLAKTMYFTESGEYVLTVRALTTDKTIQVIKSRKFIVDINKPIIKINEIVAFSEETGRVSNNKLSGKIKISGTYSDDLQDYLGAVGDACLKLKVGNVTKDITNVTRNYNGTDWDWYYIWDTQDISGGFLDKVTASTVNFECSCKDIAGTLGSASRSTYSVVPYIATVVGSNNGAVYPVRQYASNKWQNPADKQKYSVAVGTTVEVKGFNLKQGTQNPTVTMSGQNVSVVSSDVNSVKFVVGETQQSDFVNISVNNTPTDNTLYFNVWAFTKLDRDGRNDTLDAEGYDACLMSSTVVKNGKTTNPIFVTFARNHKISGEYTQADYSAFSFYEGKNADAYSYGDIIVEATNPKEPKIVDPVFYCALARVDNDKFATMFTYDENGNKNYFTKFGVITMSDTTGTSCNVQGGSVNSNCIKSGRVLYDNSLYFIACYDDDSRSSSAKPKVCFASTNGSSEITLDSKYNCNGYYDLALVPWNSGKIPVLLFSDGTKISLKYSTDTSSSALDHGKNKPLVNVKYCTIVGSLAGKSVHIAYQGSENDLVYTRCEFDGSEWKYSSLVNLEQHSTQIDGVSEGVTGAFTDIDISNVAKTKGGVTYANGSPHISYINSGSLNTTSALRYARSQNVSPKQEEWEYMVVPSKVAVGSGQAILKTDVAGNPVILYKGNDRLYVARLLD